MEVGILESMDVTHTTVCREVQIVSGVSILNFSALRNLLKLLRSSIGLHMLFGFWDQKIAGCKTADLILDQLYCIFVS